MQIKPKKPLAIELVQITDAHLNNKEGGTLLGMNTDESLSSVVSLIERERADTDILLATGDISDNGSVASYRRFHALTKHLSDNIFWLKGNHDLRAAMHEAVAQGDQLERVINIGNWTILMLDSSVEGEVGGNFSTEQLEFLKENLNASQGEHVLVCLHHHPVATGCEWLDPQQVANSDQFFNILDQFSHVRGVLWGHIHQTVDIQRKGVRLMATPSSCVQFAPNSVDFKLDRKSPGYRWLSLAPDGEIKSEVSRVANFHFDDEIDFEGNNFY